MKRFVGKFNGRFIRLIHVNCQFFAVAEISYSGINSIIE